MCDKILIYAVLTAFLQFTIEKVVEEEVVVKKKVGT